MKLILVVFMALLMMGTVSAWEWDNVKQEIEYSKDAKISLGENDIEYNVIWEKYGPIKIVNALGLPLLGSDIWVGALDEHTQICSDGCFSTIDIYLNEDTSLIDEIQFLKLKDNTWSETEAIEYKIYLKNGEKEITVDEFEYQCENVLDLQENVTKVCSNVKVRSHIELEPIWEEYSLGEKTEAGLYKIKITGQKKPKEVIDWQILTQGKVIDNWAVWGATLVSDGLISYYSFDDTLNDDTGTHNLSGNGGISFMPGKRNNAIYCSGNPQNTSANSSDITYNYENTTISMWVFFNTSGNLDSTEFFRVDSGGTTPMVWAMNSTHDFTVVSFSPGYTVAGLGPLVNDTWNHLVFTFNNTMRNVWINGVLEDSNETAGVIETGWQLGFCYNVRTEQNHWNGGIDEVGVWNRSLTDAEIQDLFLNLTGPEITLNTPVDDLLSVEPEVTFNCSADDSDGVLNLSLFIDDALNLTVLNTTASQNLSLQTSLDLLPGDYNWTCNAFDPDGIEGVIGVRNVSIKNFIENSQTFNTSAFETESQTFILNITKGILSTATANLFYNNVNRGAGTISGSSSESIFTRSLDTPLVSGATNKSVWWEITINSEVSNSTMGNQTVQDIIFNLCNATLDVPYINFSFKNETLSTEDITATISSSWVFFLGSGLTNSSLTFINATENTNYSFCFSQSERLLNVIYSLDYNNAGSQQRSTRATSVLSNITTGRILFLLPTNLGLFSPFRTTTSNLESLSEVLGTITRSLGGSTITIASSLTDDSGFVTYFLNPDASYDAVFSKTGFPQNSFSFTPTTETRTVVMGTQIGDIANGTIITYNTSYVITPFNSTLGNNTNFNFSFNLTSTQAITFISMNITNNSGTQLLFASNAGTGVISGIVNTGNLSQIIGKYIYQTTNESFSITRTWNVAVDFIGEYSLFRQMTLYIEYGFDDFWRLLIVISVLAGTLIFMSTNEVTDTSESKVIASVLLIWAFSVVGWVNTGITTASTSSGVRDLSQFSNQYGIAIIASAFGVYFILRRLFIRRI